MSIQEEMKRIIKAAGITPKGDTVSELLEEFSQIGGEGGGGGGTGTLTVYLTDGTDEKGAYLADEDGAFTIADLAAAIDEGEKVQFVYRMVDGDTTFLCPAQELTTIRTQDSAAMAFQVYTFANDGAMTLYSCEGDGDDVAKFRRDDSTSRTPVTVVIKMTGEKTARSDSHTAGEIWEALQSDKPVKFRMAWAVEGLEMLATSSVITGAKGTVDDATKYTFTVNFVSDTGTASAQSTACTADEYPVFNME